jgi:RNA polymerase sigma-70 factor (ECF subfamily)
MLVDFHNLFSRYAQDVYRFTLYLTSDPSLAEEVAQETFVRAWLSPGEIREGTVKAYLLTIARNLCRAERKRKARQVELNGEFADPKPGPETEASGRSGLDVVLEALQTLPEFDRAALLMHAQDGLPYAAIGASLGLSIAAVKVRVHRARVKLRQMCDEKDLEL